MIAINHAMTGTAIGLLIGQPVLAIPLAVFSHYVCDVLPHYHPDMDGNSRIKRRRFKHYLIADAIACLVLVGILMLLRPEHWLLAITCAFLAAAPDLMSLNRYLTIRRGRDWQPGRYVRFAIGIQWFERPIGAVVEIAWFIAATFVIWPFIR